jgi:imidazolonepropionase-like amidohydrolase
MGPTKRHGNTWRTVAEKVYPVPEALASGTSLAAQACGLAAETGRLAAGYDADLLVVAGDPTTDITALRNVRTVVSRGRVVHLDST